MSRRRKGRQVSGWLIVDKPAGIGSTDVVARVRRAFGAQKAGHAGTLDPAATGVLAVALGEATKAVPYLESALKAYRFAVRWGAATVSDDAEGAVLVTSAARPERAAIEAALPAFRGQILQVPPKVSAVHVDGARAHDLVREGVDFDLAARPLWVERLELVDASRDEAILEMVCGKGGYVRAIARDLGAALGVPAHVGWLRRLWSGPFRAEDGLSLDDLDRLAGLGELDGQLRPIQAALVDLAEVQVTWEGAERLAHGNPGAIAGPCPEEGAEVWAARDGRALAVGVVQRGQLAPRRVFLPDGA